MNMNYKVTIAIATYKRLEYLKEAVESAICQTYQNIEVLIGQDPTDVGLYKPIEEWAKGSAVKNPKVRYRYNSKRLGLSGNFNALADDATGDYIVFIGDDDHLLPDFVTKLQKAMEPDIDLAFSNHYLIDEKANRLIEESCNLTNRYHRNYIPPGKVDHPEILAWRQSIPMSASLIRTERVLSLRFREDLNTPDIDFCIRLAQNGGRFFFIPEYLAEYRTHRGSATASGLWLAKLVPYLIETPVSKSVEPYKKKTISGFMVNAISECIYNGDMKKARELFCSGYFPVSFLNFLRLIRSVIRKSIKHEELPG